MHILILGGAGYIGSHMVRTAIAAGHTVAVIDDLSTGNRAAVPDQIPFEQQSVGNKDWLLPFLEAHRFDLIMHFCAFSLVGESVEHPEKYYRNNVVNTQTLLDCMVATGHRHLVFSSTAAVYGEPQSDLIDESHQKKPINPYGETKMAVEAMLQAYAQEHQLNSVSLRYFNAAGAAPDGGIGEKHEPETHLIPNILKSAASGGELALKVFGTDYPTPDGSCVRDYVHVNDLASAHLLAGAYAIENPGAHAFNLGNGLGFSVLDVISAASAVTDQNIDYDICERRAGDPPVLVADASRAKDILGWVPEFTTIESIIQTAWPWHKHAEQFKSGGQGS